MGNFKFRLSDMMPNAWFYKLKNSSQHHHPVKNKKHYLTTASTPNHQTTQPQISHPRHSYYFTREPFKPDHHHPTLPNSPTNPKTSDLHFPLDPPRKSSKTTRSKRRTIRSSSKIVTSSVSAGCSCRATLESVWTNKSDSPPDYSVSSLRGSPDEMDFQESSLSPEFDSIGVEAANLSWSSSCNCRVSSSPTDIIIDIDTKRSPPTKKFEKQLDGFDSISELDLPPILTKPVKFSNNNKKKETEPSKLRRKLEEKNVHGSLSVKIVKEENIKAVKHQKTSPLIRRSSPNSPGLKLRSNSPRIASRKSHTKDMTSRIAHSLLGPKARQRTPTTRWSNSIQTSTRKTTISSTTSLSSKKMNISESFAIIKSSFDPQRDFRESMVEMIVENNIRSSRDLEDLLACYLSLNSNEYHDIIVKVFEQIWFDLTDIRL